jgi:hypothetical protein
VLERRCVGRFFHAALLSDAPSHAAKSPRLAGLNTVSSWDRSTADLDSSRTRSGEHCDVVHAARRSRQLSPVRGIHFSGPFKHYMERYESRYESPFLVAVCSA